MKNSQSGKCPVCKLVGLLVIIGALNWGSVGAFQVNVIETLLGSMPLAERIAYILVGVGGLMALAMCFKACPCTKPKAG